MILDAALVAALMRDKELHTCVDQTGMAPAAYIKSTWDFHRVVLRSGERMIVGIAESGCLASQNNAVRVFRETSGGYRLVFSDNAMPEAVDVRTDGTISTAAHDTIDTIVEPVYVWNGSTYVFAPERSTMYDVAVEQRRPYQISVRFAPGENSTLLKGTFAENFGQTYVFTAKAGQHATIEAIGQTRTLAAALTFEDRDVGDVSGGRWSSKLPFSGTYTLDVFGLSLRDARTLYPYAIRLTIY